jgi:aspartate dehydrogenase
MKPNEITVAVIGYGAIGQTLCARLVAQGQGPRLVGVLTRSAGHEVRSNLPASVAPVGSIDELVHLGADIVVEAAGQEALLAYAPALLDAGKDVMMISTGALAGHGVLEDFQARAQQGGARLFVPAGAIAGLDGLGAHRIAGLTRVVYTSTKPPVAWRGTPAETLLALDTLRERTVFFEGSAREAALAYPKNANLAATVALAGIGLDETKVRLVADPAAEGNAGMIEAESPIGSLRVEMVGKASANPKTSASTAYSLAHALANLTSTLII